MADILAAVKLSLKQKATAFDEDINEIIEAAKLDLRGAGVELIDDTDKMTRQAIKLYCKANYGTDPADMDKYQKQFDKLKLNMSVSKYYKTVVV